MPDEHASEFAETLAALKSEDHDTSISEQTEFADIIDEEEVFEAEAKERFFQRLFWGLVVLWLILDAESLFDVLGAIIF